LTSGNVDVNLKAAGRIPANMSLSLIFLIVVITGCVILMNIRKSSIIVIKLVMVTLLINEVIKK